MSVEAPPVTDRPAEPGPNPRTTAAVLAITFLVVAGVVLALLAGAPAGSTRAAIGTREPVVAGSTLASGITAQTHGRAVDVRCPDMPARAGASVVCTASVDGAPAHIRTTITAIQGSRAQFDFAQVP